MSDKRILIVGGVAAGASCAARARRVDEGAEIVVFERGPHVSFANCGLPYRVGDVIEADGDLLLVTPQRFRERFAIDVRVRTEVLAIDRATSSITVRSPDGTVSQEPYDALVLATGAGPRRPPIPGLDLPGVFTVRTVPDVERIRDWLEHDDVRSAAVLGGGFIGLELAENLHRRGLAVHVVEMQDQVLPPLDPEMSATVAEHLRESGVSLHLGQAVAAVEQADHGLTVRTSRGTDLAVDVVVLGLGVAPRTKLAADAGLTIGPLGGITTSASMQTSDPTIWAVGDVIETTATVTGLPALRPLAGPANRQGRLAADAIAGRDVRFRGVQGTTVCGLFGLTVASTGASARELAAAGMAHEATWLHPKDHVGYYPGAETMQLKLLFSPEDGRVLGAQATGPSGVDKRIDVLAMAIQMGATVFDLEEAELCYAPQYGAAKDPVNMAGMIAANQLRGDLPAARWDELEASGALLVDVREPDEFEAGHVPGAINAPLSGLRQHLEELPRDRPIWLYCYSGKRSYDAVRALVQRGFDARTLPGGIQSWRQRQGA